MTRLTDLRGLGLWLTLVLVLGLLAGAAFAQQPASSLDLAAWQQTATRAEEAVQAGRASDSALEALRAELVDWRTKFVAAQSANAVSIATVKAQIEALGPVPETGVEAEDIANTRAELNTQLSALQAPIRSAEVAYTRADGLIRGIDGLVRDRQSEALMERGASPLNPANWPRALSAMNASLINIKNEMLAAWSNTVQVEYFKAQLPIVLVLVVLGMVLLARGWHWMVKLTHRVQTGRPTTGRWMMAFVASLGQMVVPFIGVIALVEAGYATGLQGLRGEQLLSALRPAGFMLFSAMWLGARLFPRAEQDHPLLSLPPESRREGRIDTGLIGLILAVNLIVNEVAGYDNWSLMVLTVAVFPLMVLAGLLMLRISRLLRNHGRARAEAGDRAAGYTDRLLVLLGRILAVLAIVGPALAAVGYFRAGQAVVFPTLFSLLLLAFLFVLQRLVAEIWVLFQGGREGAREGLMPVLMGFALMLGSAPLFALIWGTRVTDLSELWTRAAEGFSFGDSRISPGDFLTVIVVFGVGYTLTRLLQGTLKNTVLPKTKMDVGGQNALVSGLGYVGIFLAGIVAITAAGIDLSSLAIVAGALSVGIGFGLQNIVSNFVSGIILLIERPISEGDWIEVGGQMGYVRDISVRSTRIETFDRTDVIVPNADFVSGTVTNYTRGNTIGRVIVPVGVAYGTDTRKVETILRDIAKAHPMVLAHPEPKVLFQAFGADSLDFEIRAILRDVNWVLSVKSDINHEIAKRFAEEGIEIPFAQRDIWLRNPEALAGIGGAAPEAAPPPAGGGAERPGVARVAHLDEADMGADESDDTDAETGGEGSAR